jgi:hypothetical protein
MKLKNKGFSNIHKETISTLEDKLLYNVEKKIHNCSKEKRENYLQIIEMNEKFVELDNKIQKMKDEDYKLQRVIRRTGKSIGGGFKKRTKKLDDILSPWANCDNKGIDGDNSRYHEEVAPKIAKMRIGYKTKKRK